MLAGGLALAQEPVVLQNAKTPLARTTGKRTFCASWAKKSASGTSLTVREAAKYLGVSPQSVYLWVERKQIPHLRVMGRNIRFLRPDLETFRASFKQEMENE